MGKALIISGADFSSAKIETVVLYDDLVITPVFTDGKAVGVATGSVDNVANQKYCSEVIPEGFNVIRIRSTGYSAYGIAFFDSSDNYISGFGSGDYNLHDVPLPSNAYSFKYSYLNDSRAGVLDKPIVNTLTLL